MAMPKIGKVALNRNFGDVEAVSVIKERSHFGRYIKVLSRKEAETIASARSAMTLPA
jgi:hypothetical protein